MLVSIKRSFSGLVAQMNRLSAVGGNISNATTPGFKRTEGTFSELLLSGLDRNHVPIVPGEEQNLARGVEFRGETRFTQGAFVPTGRPLDIAIEGSAFIELVDENGAVSFTRDGSFMRDVTGRLVHGSGAWLPNLIVPAEASVLDISHEGVVSMFLGEQVTEVGQIRLVAFTNPTGLESLGRSLFAPSANSGSAEVANEVRLHQGFLELSNVNLADEMTSLLRAQRAYQANSQSVRTLDEMWEGVNALRR